MGWFDEQIRQRKKSDQQVFEEAFLELSDAVTGKKEAAVYMGVGERSKNAVDEILKYYRVKSREVPDTVKDPEDRMEYLLRPHGIMKRSVKLDKGWYKDAVGPYLATRKSDGASVAMIPGAVGGYKYINPDNGSKVKVSEKNEGDFEEMAYAFYKPFPLKKLSIPDLMKYVISIMSVSDFVFYGLTILIVTLIGMMTPKLQNFLFSTVIEAGSVKLLLSVALFMVSVTLSQLIIGAARELILTRLNTKMSIYIQAATMMRVMSLPANFFKQYSSGELSSRAQYIGSLCNMLISTVLSTGLTVANIKPILDMAKPILDAEPEVSEGKQVVTKIMGGIEVNNVSFRYTDSMPNVLENLSLKITPGQYVAIVGATGCGKSTLMRLLLGFETPQRGAIYYDGRDISTLDLKSLRRKIGVVMQNGKLFTGDIFSNIIISAPQLTMQEAWDAAELAGIADDIRAMPMGMNTIISEGSGGISGGQRQRLMIARAVAPKPRILMLDEATSALDNLTQKKVSESLDGLKCTRIVIAHRLSTIKQCDRIIYLENGRIAEDGTYDELIKLGGRFAELVERQRLDA